MLYPKAFHDPALRKAIVKNLLSLSALQYASYIFPLITVPYLTRVIGVDKFGLVAFAQATVMYFNMLVNYGFPFSATRQVAIDKDDQCKLSAIITNVVWSKIILALVSLVLVAGLVTAMPSYRSEHLVFLASYTIVIGSVFSVDWFFQGLGDMKYITLIGLASRTIATLLVFAIVRSRSDYIYVPALAGLGAIAGGAFCLWLVWKKYRIFLGAPKIRNVWAQLCEGWDAFLSSSFISLYTTSNIFILGLLTNTTQVGYYSGAEKVVGGIRSLWAPVPQVLYPHFSGLSSRDPVAAKAQLRFVLVITGVITLAMSVLGCLAAPIIVRYYLGQRFTPSIEVIQIMVFVVFAIGISTVLGVQGLMANGESAAFRNIVLVSGILNLMLLYPFIKYFGIVGPAISVVIVEFFIVVLEWGSLRKRQLI